jgi:hypothetical protein
MGWVGEGEMDYGWVGRLRWIWPLDKDWMGDGCGCWG